MRNIGIKSAKSIARKTVSISNTIQKEYDLPKYINSIKKEQISAQIQSYFNQRRPKVILALDLHEEAFIHRMFRPQEVYYDVYATITRSKERRFLVVSSKKLKKSTISKLYEH